MTLAVTDLESHNQQETRKATSLDENFNWTFQIKNYSVFNHNPWPKRNKLWSIINFDHVSNTSIGETVGILYLNKGMRGFTYNLNYLNILMLTKIYQTNIHFGMRLRLELFCLNNDL